MSILITATAASTAHRPSLTRRNFRLMVKMVTHTYKECGNSWKIEEVVIWEGLEQLQRNEIHVIEAIHDDKAQIDAILI
jgi:hypothetical protein